MEVLFSQNADYLQYGLCLSIQDYQGAADALIRCMAIEAIRQNPCQQASLNQALGDVRFSMGLEEEAIVCFDASEKMDASSLFPVYGYAKFLAQKMRNFRSAIVKCDDIVRQTKLQPFPATEDDFSSDWYQQRSLALKVFCLQCLADPNREKQAEQAFLQTLTVQSPPWEKRR